MDGTGWPDRVRADPSEPTGRLEQLSPESDPEDRGPIRIRHPAGLLEVTRRLPEGPWDPTKIPRIQILMSLDAFLVGMGGVIFTQVEG